MLCALVASAMSVWADGVTFSPLQYEQLPSMQTPRRGHACFVTPAGDIVVVGGHTTDFELTTSAERLHDGAWESISINNPHDGGACVALPDGRFLICGGFGFGWGMDQRLMSLVGSRILMVPLRLLSSTTTCRLKPCRLTMANSFLAAITMVPIRWSRLRVTSSLRVARIPKTARPISTS